MAEGRIRRWVRIGARVVGFGAVGAGVLGLVGVLGLAVGYRKYVVQEPGTQLDRRYIRSVIAQESPVYFRDGTTRVGVFFEAEHRQYVAADDLPLAWSMAIVAAEDAAFYGHPGIDVRGIARAMRDNVSSGSLVAGGSTLTQQTAKNLYYRPDRSVRSKGVELLNALRLEAHYEKSEILTFYANQFHVTGNGRGLGIGARYFFDKEVEDLEVAEAAFLAGLVKAPARYDPFLGDEARRADASARAHDRTRYVLRRITEVPVEQLVPADRTPETRARAQAVQDQARQLLADGFTLGFRRGTFRYDASAVLDEVARRLGEPPFDAILAERGVTDPATAGLQVITTLDANAQAAATYGLWHHLTDVGLQLEGGRVEALRVEGRGPRFDPDRPPVAREFRLASVTGIREVAGKKALDVDLGGHPCHVDREALVRVAAAAAKGVGGSRSAKASSADVDALAEFLAPGTVVHVSVRKVDASGATCDLELTPELQGAVMVVEGGRIRAMVGGNDNRNFNRATALRQMGSTWKPLVYHAALQLGWSPSDALDNRRHVFPFSTTFYYPRPDHEPAPVVSMSWAAVNSENLGSVWLLYHLTDRLDGDQVRALAASLDLARREGEGETEYRTRIQKAGVLPTRARVEEALFLQSRQEVLAGLSSGGFPEDELALRSLLFGWGFASERERVRSEGPRTRAWKERALDNSWRRLEPMLAPCARQHAALVEAFDADVTPDPRDVPDLTVWLDGDEIRVACGAIPEGYVAPDADFVASLDPDRAVAEETEDSDLPAEEATEPEPEPVRRLRRPQLSWWERLRGDRGGPRPVDVTAMRIDDRLSLGTLRAVGDALERRQTAMALRSHLPDLYDPELLYWHPDFRVLLAIRYVASIAEQYGVQTEIPTVLSMPLGATEITLEEATSVYGGMIGGTAWSFPGEAGGRDVPAAPSPALLIEEIRDVDGHSIYRARQEPVPVAKAGTPELTAHILRNVVRYGTGRRALAVTAGGRQIPVGGKTGTTNEYRNAAFLGFAPVYAAGAYQSAGGYAVGVYVGYDDNRPLESGNIRLAGASGALPAWVETVAGLRDAGFLGEPVAADPADGDLSVEWPLWSPPSLVEVQVDADVGLLLAEPDPSQPGVDVPTVLVPRTAPPELDYRPFRRPHRIFPRTDTTADEIPAEAGDPAPDEDIY